MIDFYEKIKKEDFLNKNIPIENFDWNEFSSNANISNIHFLGENAKHLILLVLIKFNIKLFLNLSKI